MTKNQEILIKLAEKKGGDADLLLLDLIHELEEKLEKIEKEHKEFEKYHEESMMEVKTGIPKFQELIESIKELADKEIPQPIVNISPSIVNVAPPQIKIEQPNIKLPAPIVNLPAPIVNVKAEVKGETDQELKATVEDIKTAQEEIYAEIKKLKEEKKLIRSSGVSRMAVSYYDISSELNGVLKTFWIPTHMGIIAVIGSSAPFIFRPTVDYVESGHNILFDAGVDASLSLAAGQSVIILIKRN